MTADIEPDVNSIHDDANLEKLQICEETVNSSEKVGTQDFELLKVLGKLYLISFFKNKFFNFLLIKKIFRKRRLWKSISS